MALVAAGAVHVTRLPTLMAIIMSFLALIGAFFAARHALRPTLSIRVLNQGVEFRVCTESSWQRLGPDSARFVSPWFIGWRGRRGRGFGVFRGQLPADDFRVLAVALRNDRRER